ncbi:MAG: PAS domain S-box protein [Phycisphaerales bacterium]|nr:PAS domain S-box protein [Phycisphaerales bacterium]
MILRDNRLTGLLWVMVGVCVLSMGGVATFYHLALGRVARTTIESSSEAQAELRASYALIESLSLTQNALQNLLRERDPDALEVLVGDLEARQDDLTVRVDRLGDRGITVKSRLASWKERCGFIVDTFLRGERAEANSGLVNSLMPESERVLAEVREVNEANAREVATRTQKMEADILSTRYKAIASVAAAGLTVLAGAVVLRGQVLRGTGAVTEILGRLSSLRAANDLLEEKVKARTAEIERSNVELHGKKQALEQEIVERTRVEEALRETNVALQNAMPGISRLDPEGRYVRVNDAYAAMVGRSTDELIGAHWTVTVDPKDHEHGTGAFHRMVRDGTCDFEASAVRKDGSTFYKQVLLVRITSENGDFAGHHCFMRDISERKRAESEKEEAHRKLVDLSRRAGMAEVATNVLHNVGNVLTSVNVSASLLKEQVQKSQVADLIEVSALLQRTEDLGTYVTQDEKGKLVPRFLAELGRHLADEQRSALTELDALLANIEHVKDIVGTQQAYSKVSGVTEEVSVAELLDAALRVHSGAFVRHKVQLSRDYATAPPLLVDKQKVLQILINLLSNAKYALDSLPPEERSLIARIRTSGPDDHGVRIEVVDNGMGIAADNLTRIFAHGFTTRKEGHGFGLHSSALAARELGGSLSAFSDGLGRGATFTLELPLRPSEVVA